MSDKKKEPKWFLSMESPDESCEVIAEVYEEKRDGVSFWKYGYRWDTGHDCGEFFEESPQREIYGLEKEGAITGHVARAYSMNGAGDWAIENDIPWATEWQCWVETGEQSWEEWVAKGEGLENYG